MNQSLFSEVKCRIRPEVDLITGDRLSANFKSFPLKLELDAENMIPPSLMKVQELISRQTPPKRRKGCKDCELLTRMANRAQIGDRIEKTLVHLSPQETARLYAALEDFHRGKGCDPEEAGFDPKGIIAPWDFTNKK